MLKHKIVICYGQHRFAVMYMDGDEEDRCCAAAQIIGWMKKAGYNLDKVWGWDGNGAILNTGIEKPLVPLSEIFS